MNDAPPAFFTTLTMGRAGPVGPGSSTYGRSRYSGTRHHSTGKFSGTHSTLNQRRKAPEPIEPTTDTENLSAAPGRGDGYVYRVSVSSSPMYGLNGQNPATLYRHEIDRWTPKRVFVERAPEAVTEGDTAPRWYREQEGCFSLDREEMERDGEVYHRPIRGRFYLHREDAEAIVEEHEPDTPDCLDTLGLDRSATEADVKEAFRAQSKELHPDHGGDPAAFRRLRDAYEDALETV